MEIDSVAKPTPSAPMEPSSASSDLHAGADEEELDWGGSEDFQSCMGDAPVDAADFTVAPNFDGEALVPPTASSDAPLERLGLELNSVRNDMFPDFLQPNKCLNQLGVSEAMSRMQDIKNARRSLCAGDPPRRTNTIPRFELA